MIAATARTIPKTYASLARSGFDAMVSPPGRQIDVAMPDFGGLNGRMCELVHTSAIVQKMQCGQKPHGIGDYLHVGVEKAPAFDGRGKLAERSETSSSAFPALHASGRTFLCRFAHVQRLVYLRQKFAR